jgi:flagellar protein FlaI
LRAEKESALESASTGFRDFYSVNPPFGHVGIEVNEATGKLRYLTLEPILSAEEVLVLEELKEIIIERMDIPLSVLRDEEAMDGYLKEQLQHAFKKFKKIVAEESEEKYIYYLKRDFLGYGKVDLLIRDENIEDISCNGADTPIYIWHSRYESIPTNVKFESEGELASIVTRLAYKSGHQISVSRPIMEGTLPEGYRVHLTLSEVSKRGSTFTIRKFKPNPYTIIDLINFGTISPQIAAYLWVLIENMCSVMISGAAASGKTALLNSICMFVMPEMKVVTIEEVQELRLHENWIPMVTRSSFQPGVQEITLFELLKSALRQRPDYIIVGEVRGEEAYTLFQAIATGHGGMCTTHAHNVKSAIKRLMTRPMDIPAMMLPLMNVFIQIRRVKRGDQIVRRAVTVAEIAEGPPGGDRPQIERRFEWRVEDDTFTYNPPSIIGTDIFKLISENKHIPLEKLKEEQDRRETILRWMAKNNVSSYDDVANVVRSYYLTPDEVYNNARMDIS